MTKENIKDMFLLAAAVRHMKEDDPRLEMASRQLAEMNREYLDTVLGGRREDETGRPDWKGALTYLVGVFKELDAAAEKNRNGDPDTLNAEIAQRHAVWEIVSNGVMNWYMQQEKDPEANRKPKK